MEAEIAAGLEKDPNRDLPRMTVPAATPVRHEDARVALLLTPERTATVMDLVLREPEIEEQWQADPEAERSQASVELAELIEDHDVSPAGTKSHLRSLQVLSFALSSMLWIISTYNRVVLQEVFEKSYAKSIALRDLSERVRRTERLEDELRKAKQQIRHLEVRRDTDAAEYRNSLQTLTELKDAKSREVKDLEIEKSLLLKQNAQLRKKKTGEYSEFVFEY